MVTKNNLFEDEGFHPAKKSLSEEEVIFDRATRKVDPDERDAYLERACAGAPELRKRVEALLRAHDEAEVFFEHDALVAHATAVVRPLREKGTSASVDDGPEEQIPAGTRIDRYRVIECIGRGGCGLVYLAQQEEPLRRQVALKVIRRGKESRNVIARFEAERQALAMMDHPCIARVFDASQTDWGAPFFVMEHVRGVRITDFCDQHRLSVNERLDLFVRICHAIQHAHQKGIIHGDVKPSNIIVAQHDGVPVPKVIDFGISRATEMRRSGNADRQLYPLAGTPAYMSPEALEVGGADADTRSDIYSLGVLLFELLIGRTPVPADELRDADWETLRQRLCEETPPRILEVFAALGPEERRGIAARRGVRPAELAQILRDDLGSIVFKAMRKDRQERYETANALAMEIGRHLNYEPVLAHPTNWIYRTGKLARRNRAAFVATGSVALALVLGLGASTWLFLKERDARERAVAAEQQQARLRLDAENREKVTQAAFFISQERFAPADDLLRDVRIEEATLEGAAVYRALGEWHALHERWRQAVDRFSVLLQINQLEGSDVRSLDYLEMGPALIELGDLAGYQRFRERAIERFADGQPLFADRIVKISLLTPASEPLLRALEPLAAATRRYLDEAIAVGHTFEAAWRAMSLALYAYRMGDYSQALRWSERCLIDVDANYPRSATVYIVAAMAHARLGQSSAARLSYERGRALITARFQTTDRGTPVQGFWFDWALARILMREGESVLNHPFAGPFSPGS